MFSFAERNKQNITFVNSTVGTQADFNLHFVAVNDNGEECVKMIQDKMCARLLQCWSCTCDIDAAIVT